MKLSDSAEHSPQSTWKRRGAPGGKKPSTAARRFGTIAATTAVVFAGVPATPSSATPTGPGVRDGKNITVFHNIDFVAVSGWGAGEEIRVDVVRNGVTIGTAAGPAADPEASGAFGLEVNHGPEGAAGPGDCWTGHTPDVRPGDRIIVTSADGSTDETTVDEIYFTGNPVEEVDPVNPGVNGDIVLKGIAKRYNGEPIPIAQLDSAEFRDGQFRGVPDSVEVDPEVEGGFIVRYNPPYNLERNRDNLNEAQRKASLLGVTSGHAVGFGHTEVLPPDAMLVEGVDDTPGPALGCEASPSARDAVTDVTPAVLNKEAVDTAGNLQLSGVSFGATAVDVTVTDAAGTAVTAAATPTGTTQQTWTAALPMSEIAALVDGDLTVSMSSTREGTPLVGSGRTLMKDVVLPNSPTPSLEPKGYIGNQSVALNGGAGDQLRWALGDANVEAPTATSGTPYTTQINITSTQTLKAVAVDQAGNVSEPFVGLYDITQPSRPDAPTVGTASAGNARASFSWTAPEFTGNSAITGYTVRAHPRSGSPIEETVAAGATTKTFTGLQNGMPYTFDVAANNGVAQSAFSAKTAAVTPATRPGRPEMGFATAQRGRATVTWQRPDDNGGAAIQSFQLRVYRSNLLVRTINAGNRTRATVTRLANGASYRFAVRASNRTGFGAFSVRSNAVRPRSVATSPRIRRATAGAPGGASTARASWLAPRSTGGARITGYRVMALRLASNGAVIRRVSSGIRPARARALNMRLAPGRYRFQVRAFNAMGASKWSPRSNPTRAR